MFKKGRKSGNTRLCATQYRTRDQINYTNRSTDTIQYKNMLSDESSRKQSRQK